MSPRTDRRTLHRRTFLRGAGVSLALPLFDGMSRLRAADGPGKPKPAAPPRAAFIYVPNGVATRHWFPAKTGVAFEFSRSLKPLEPFRSDVTVLSGLHHPKARNGHDVGSNWLTAVDLQGTPGYSFRNDVSVDQMIAEEVGKATRHPSIALATDAGGSISWGRGSVLVPTLNDPRVVFDHLFTASGQDPAAARGRIGRDQSLLDLVLDDARSLDRRLGRGDRDKLAEYLNSVREVEQRLERARRWIDVPRPRVSSDFIRARGWGDNVTGYLQSMFDVLVLAFRTDSTRVASYAVWNETASFVIRETGVKRGQHELTHNNNDPDMLDDLAKVDTFLVAALAYFLKRLKETPEGQGTLLDTTMVMYGSGASQTHLHYHLPMVLAGGSKLGLRHGQHLDFSLAGRTANKSATQDLEQAMMFDGKAVNPDARVSNLLLTIAQKMGLPLTAFRDSTGPIGQLLKS